MPGDPLDPPANGGGTDPLNPLLGGGSVTATLVDLCDIIRDTESSDGQGTSTKTPTTVASNVPCSLTKARQQHETVQAGALIAITTWTIQVPIGTDVQPEDRVIKDDLVYNVSDTDKGLTNPIFLTATLVRATR